MKKLNLEDIDFKNKTVLMRVDFNVPLRDGKVMDDQRIVAAMDSIEYVTQKGGKLVLVSHLGRPKGKKVAEMSLRPVADKLSELIGKKISFQDDCIGEKVEKAVLELSAGNILLLENLRFYKEETENDETFSKKLADLADVYVNDAFGTAHRAHASTEGVTRFISLSVAGYLMEKELRYLKRALDNPQRPFVAIIGGAKISGKIDVISALLPKVDKLIIGGAMIFTFFKAMGRNIGNSLLEEDKVLLAGELLKKDADKILLPVDCMVSDHFDFAKGAVGALKAVKSDGIKDGFWGLDIGPLTLEHFQAVLNTSKTVVWNGPMGVFEIEKTAVGTNAIAKTLGEITEKGATTVIGGGDSAAAVRKAGITDKVSHVSTGGGASLEFLEGKKLPGIYALTDK